MNAEVTNKILTLPNLISFIRLLLVPAFAVLLVVYENNVAACVLFVIAATTDFLDGAIARATGQISKLGQQLDPLVDRILVVTAVILVYVTGRVPLWVLLLIVARDLSMMVLMGQLRAAGETEFKVAFVGKAATAFMMTGFSMLILYWPVVNGAGIFDSPYFPGWGSELTPMGIWFVYVGVLLAWTAGIYYMIRAYVGSRKAQTASRSASQSTVRGTAQSTERGTTQGAARGTAQTVTRSATQAATRVAPRSKPPSKMSNSTLGILFNTPRKALAGIALLLCIVVIIGFYSLDSANNFGVIHSGVKVGDLDVGRLEESEASLLINTQYGGIADSAPIAFFASEEAAQAGVDETTQQLGNRVALYDQSEADYGATSWSATMATFNAKVNGEELAEQAYSIGRGDDFLLGRLAASMFGVTIEPTIDFSEERLNNIEVMLTESIGIPMHNADIVFENGHFKALDGQDGITVDEEVFEELLKEAFLTEDRTFVVPMVERQMYITLEDAQLVAESTQKAIDEPITVSYGGESWTLTADELGQYISTAAQKDEKGVWHLVASVNAALLEARLPEITGHIEDQIAPLNAEFVEVEGDLLLIPSQNGTGVDYGQLANDLNTVLFGHAIDDGQESGSEQHVNSHNENIDIEARIVPMRIGIIEPKLRTSDAEALDFSTKITEFTIEYWWVEQGTITNIHIASNLINSSIIAPDGIWSFNETAGWCTAEKGFVEAQVILGDEYVDEIGGGICTVASTVFNAAFEAGYPIVERVNHTLRLTRYPVGRDAAIAYPYADLKFHNDTDNYLLLTMSYTNYSVTCTLWGIPPGYIVESETGELIEGADYPTKRIENEDMAPGQEFVEQAGKKASRVEVLRIVYDAEGNIRERRTFYSAYDATPEIIQVGPKD